MQALTVVETNLLCCYFSKTVQVADERKLISVKNKIQHC